MIRVREQGGFKLPLRYCNKYIEVGVSNRYITTEEEKKLSFDRLSILSENSRKLIFDLNGGFPKIFSLISIETSSGCNQNCPFCPVNNSVDPRPRNLLPMEFIEKIANELSTINYSFAILPFGNNEPLLDERIFEIISIFREKCPKSYIKLLTNGLLLSVEKALKLFECGLNTLTINNYSSTNKLSNPVCDIIDNAKEFICKDLRISLRNKSESLTNRGGSIFVNCNIDYRNIFCALPFVDLNISFTGNFKLCCFDALGETNFGSVGNSSLVEIWNSDNFIEIRKKIIRSRKLIDFCAKCNFDGFRDPLQDWVMPLMREDLLD